MENLQRNFGRCIRELRLEKQLSQTVFAERCGFVQAYMSRIETGRANVTLSAIEVLARALDLSVFELFDVVRHASARDG